MKPFNRSDRVGALIQEALSNLLIKSIKDPRIGSASITGVKMTADLKIAKVYFAITDRVTSKEDAAAGFKKAKGYIKNCLARQLKLRYMPELQFYYDFCSYLNRSNNHYYGKPRLYSFLFLGMDFCYYWILRSVFRIYSTKIN